MPPRAGVTAVLVSHDGATWLPEALAALARQTVRPDRVACVDTGSSDDSAQLLRRVHGTVLGLPRTTGFGAAVSAALAGAPRTPWVWLLHDDCAPDPGALAALLAHAAVSPSVALLGPKVVDWDDPRTLVEVGLTTDGAGTRVTGLEPDEPDQGQRDRPRDVLAVGTAGALVRRDVWDALGGLDPDLPLLRDDVDLGWRVNAAGHRVVVVPAARVRHARAATTGRRALDAVTGSPATADRRHALHVLLAHAPRWRLPLALARVVVGSLLRALVLLLARRARTALPELRALGQVLGHPRRLHAARRARRRTRVVPHAALRPLRARRTALLRRRVDALAARRRTGRTIAGARSGVLVAAALAVLALLAERSLLGGGTLRGGRLLPAPDGAADLWQAFAAPGGEPRLAVLAGLAGVLLGKAPAAVDVLLLAAVPLAGAVAWWASGRVVRQPVLRVWAAATWALLPVGTAAVAGGRLDAAAVQIALPALLLGGWVVLTRDPRQAGWWRAWALGLGLVPVLALAPQVWPLALVLLPGSALLVLAVVARPRRAAALRRAAACALAVAAPLPVLLPWTWLSGAGALLAGPGLPAAVPSADLPAWQLLLLAPGGPGTPARWLALGLLLGALGGLLRTGRPRAAAGGWALALIGLAYALVLARSQAGGAPVWPGVGLQVAAAGLVLAALVGAEGLAERLARAAFGWRQLLAVLVVAATAATPVLCAVAWVARGADDPLRRGAGVALPAFVRADLGASGVRALVLAVRPDGSVGWAVRDADGPRLGDPPPDARLAPLVADLVGPTGAGVAAGLAARSVRWVVAADAALAPALDTQDGLARRPAEDTLLWRVLPPAAPAPAEARPESGRLVVQGLGLLGLAVLAAPPARRRAGALP